MRLALLGWLFFFLAMLSGFVIGRYRRLTGRAEAKSRPSAAAPRPARPSPAAAPVPARTFVAASTAVPSDLPTDYRRVTSVPPPQ